MSDAREHGWYKANGRDVFGPLPKAQLSMTTEARRERAKLAEAKSQHIRGSRHWAPIDPWRER